MGTNRKWHWKQRQTKIWEEVSAEHRRIQGDTQQGNKAGITVKTFISRQTGSLVWPALRILACVCLLPDRRSKSIVLWRLSDLILTGQEICSSAVNLDSSFSTQKNLYILYQFTFLDSNTQWLFPSSSIWFHQRRPTISLPVTFWEKVIWTHIFKHHLKHYKSHLL